MPKQIRRKIKKNDLIAVRVTREEKEKALQTAVESGFDDLSTWVRYLIRKETSRK